MPLNLFRSKESNEPRPSGRDGQKCTPDRKSRSSLVLEAFTLFLEVVVHAEIVVEGQGGLNYSNTRRNSNTCTTNFYTYNVRWGDN
jgi:hypothetical protein